jgi:hypothetical protein
MQNNPLTARIVNRIRHLKMSPPLFLLLLGLVFLAPSIVIASSGGKVAPPQLPEHNFLIMRR